MKAAGQDKYSWENLKYKTYHAILTSNHSVAPTLPYSPALQLANTMLLLGLNPSVKGITNVLEQKERCPR